MRRETAKRPIGGFTQFGTGDMGAAVSTEEAPAAQASAEKGKAKDPIRPSALVICGPSGVGKGTLIKLLMSSSDRFGFSCSHTTRAPREGEQVCSGLPSKKKSISCCMRHSASARSLLGQLETEAGLSSCRAMPNAHGPLPEPKPIFVE